MIKPDTRIIEAIRGIPERDRYITDEFGAKLLSVAKSVTLPSRHSKLDRIGTPPTVGYDLELHINLVNQQVLRAANLRGVHADKFGEICYNDPTKGLDMYCGPQPDQPLHSIYDDDFIQSYLRDRLISCGALEVPAVPLEDILTRFGLEAIEEDSEEVECLVELADELLKEKIFKGFQLMTKSSEVESFMSGPVNPEECIKKVMEYISRYPRQIDIILSELYYAGDFYNNPFLFDDELGERAKLYGAVLKLLMKDQDCHPVSLSYRCTNFIQKLVPSILYCKGINLKKYDGTSRN